MIRLLDLSFLCVGLFGILPNIFRGSATKIITNILVPTLPLFTESIKIATPLFKQGLQSFRGAFPQQTGAKGAPPQYTVGPYNQPTQYPVQYLNSYGGGAQWGSGTLYPTFSGDQPWTQPVDQPGGWGMSSEPFWATSDWGAEWRSK
jgi:hypothetical protein